MIKLAAYKGTDRLVDKLIQGWTKKPYSHCELIINGLHYSSSMRDGGVRPKFIEMDPHKWDVYPIYFADENYAYLHYLDTKDRKYGFLDLVSSQILNLRVSDNRADFCSEWCAEALGLPNPASYSPGSLVDIVLLMNKHYEFANSKIYNSSTSDS